MSLRSIRATHCFTYSFARMNGDWINGGANPNSPYSSVASSRVVRIKPLQDDIKVSLHGFIALTGALFERIKVANQKGGPPGLEDVLRLECLNDTAGIAAPDPQHRRQLLMGQRHHFVAGSFNGG